MNINILTDFEVEQFCRIIDASDRIVICCHQNPDGDALGSSLGMAEYLRTLGKDPLVVVPDAFPDFLQWMPGTERIVCYDKHSERTEAALAEADLVMCLDFNTPGRTDKMADALVSSPARKILIDHHLDPDIDVEMKISQPEASSTCELVFRLIWQIGDFEAMTRKCAIPLYCGMMTDTGGFTYNSTRPEIFFIISQLLTKGINKDKIYRNVYNNYSEWRMRLTGHVLYNRLVVMSDSMPPTSFLRAVTSKSSIM